ncbi:hypothetical protein JQX08_14495 [Pseudomonas sp. UL073]|uniref:Uncharacterized protein n=1 Tax=Zestomonas insulae TaxID=2809017 RepID=A0ABS2IFQ2_9GAMM|nr:hypothetical protein [Pseudomonas insulae]MBM7061917.1 hypothetical protein [Pseudomonas insulae]
MPDQPDSAAERLASCVVPLLQEACDYAQRHGIAVELSVSPGEACLTLTTPGGSHLESLRVALGPDAEHALIEKSYEDGELLSQTVSVHGLSPTVIETELAGFFQRAAALPLGYLKPRHPAGF